MDAGNLAFWVVEQYALHGAGGEVVEGRGGVDIRRSGGGRSKWRMVVRGGEAVWTDEAPIGQAAQDALLGPGGSAEKAKAVGDAGRKAALAKLMGLG